MSDPAAALWPDEPDTEHSTALVPVDTATCPACSTPTKELTVHEPPLLRHGGYGAARRTVRVFCPALGCEWRMVREVTEVKP